MYHQSSSSIGQGCWQCGDALCQLLLRVFIIVISWKYTVSFLPNYYLFFHLLWPIVGAEVSSLLFKVNCMQPVYEQGEAMRARSRRGLSYQLMDCMLIGSCLPFYILSNSVRAFVGNDRHVVWRRHKKSLSHGRTSHGIVFCKFQSSFWKVLACLLSGKWRLWETATVCNRPTDSRVLFTVYYVQ